jgi:cytochrome c oxidase assembly protein subunit 15
MDGLALVNWEPVAHVALAGVALATGPLGWIWARHRGADTARRVHALTLLTLFLTFDLVLFGAFTRLTDSGLGCPDWPGCYGSASPIGAQEHIGAAQQAMPSGPVTHSKAWIEMVHRYLATGVGVLICVLAFASFWLRSRQPEAPHRPSPWWACITLAWVCLQGAFGALTVTMKLYPAVVTAHLLGGLVLLALLAVQAYAPERGSVRLSGAMRAGVIAVLAIATLQIALGGWVSTNYAVLACTDFPTCQGQWWPQMDFEHGFTLLRPLGMGRDGGWLPFAALTAIHFVHRIGAALTLAALVSLGVLLWRAGAQQPRLRRFAKGIWGVAAWQLATGLGNVVLGWPILAAVGHTGGAAVLVVVLITLLARSAAPVSVTTPARAARVHDTHSLGGAQ